MVIPAHLSQAAPEQGQSNPAMTDTAHIEELIARTALGDRAAFSALYDATSAKLFGVCLRVLDNRAEAEDVLQEVYIRIWHKAGMYAVNGLSPMTWLITLARNLAIDRLRARRRRAEAADDDLPEMADRAPTPEGAAIAASEAGRIAACLGELEPDRAGAVRAAYLDGASYADLAARYGVPLNTIRTWLRRSLLKLKDCLSR
jgi:RNA polymerase sigma-70 factor (ECF subfamily)